VELHVDNNTNKTLILKGDALNARSSRLLLFSVEFAESI